MSVSSHLRLSDSTIDDEREVRKEKVLHEMTFLEFSILNCSSPNNNSFLNDKITGLMYCIAFAGFNNGKFTEVI